MRIRYESDDGVTALDLARENRHDRCVASRGGHFWPQGYTLL